MKLTQYQFSSQDKEFMDLAIAEAKQAALEGNYPCGAVLVVDGKLLGKSYNQKETKKDRISHAEMLLYIQHSADLKQAKKDGRPITMYTTLEPCLMCFGAAAIHRVDRIVAASPDPYGDMSSLQGKEIGAFYATSLPKIEYGLCFEQIYDITIPFLQTKADADSYELIELLNKLKSIYLQN